MSALLRTFLIVTMAGIAYPACGDWICTEASSERRGDAILACGVGQSTDLQSARDSARDAALKEFNAICEASVTCRPFEIEVEPKRTDCEKSGSGFVCRRALAFRITDRTKSSVLVNVDSTKRELERERQTLKTLEEQYEQLLSLKALKDRTESQKKEIAKLEKKMGSVEGVQIQLEQKVSDSALSNHEYKYTHLLYNNSFRVAAAYNSLRLVNSGELLFGIEFSYEYRPFHFLGVNARYGFGADFAGGRVRSDGDVVRTGAPNTSGTQIGGLTYHDLALGTNLYTGLGGLYVRGEIGTFLGTQSNYNVTFGPLGTATSVTKSDSNFSRPYWGAGVGWDSREDKKGFGGFVEVGVKKPFGDNGAPGVVISVGGNFGF